MLNQQILRVFSKRNAQDNAMLKLQEKVKTVGLEKAFFCNQTEERNWFSFTIKLPEYMVCDQKDTGRCWAFAAYNFLRNWFIKSYDLKDFLFSINYIAFFDLLEKANSFLELVLATLEDRTDCRLLDFKLQQPIQDAGQWHFFVDLTEKYGLIPYDAMPDTQISEKTGELVLYLTQILREGAFRLRNNHANGKQWLIQEKQSILYKIYGLLVACLGKPPEHFTLKMEKKTGEVVIDKGLTPVFFLNKYIKISLKDYIAIINIPVTQRPYFKMYTVKYLGCIWENEFATFYNVPLVLFKKMIVNQLQDGYPVWFGCDSKQFVDKDEGILSLKNFNYDVIGYDITEMNKGAALEYHISSLNHAMLFKGVQYTPDKIISHWYAENSYGPFKGHHGFISMSDEWFNRFVYEAVVHKKYIDGFLDACVEKVQLEPWDSLGALA